MGCDDWADIACDCLYMGFRRISNKGRSYRQVLVQMFSEWIQSNGLAEIPYNEIRKQLERVQEGIGVVEAYKSYGGRDVLR